MDEERVGTTFAVGQALQRSSGDLRNVYLMIDAMGIVTQPSARTHRMSNDLLPQTWTGEPALATVGSFGELIVGIR